MIGLMKKWLGILLLCLCMWQSNAADIPYNDYWSRGNKYYAAKEYDSAAFYFNKLALANPNTPEVYYNLGNAHYRLNNIGEAVLYYSKALHINPNYRDAADNLELAQSRIKNRIAQSQDIFFITWWKALANPGMAGIWAVVSLILFLSLLALIFFRRTRNNVSPQVITAVGFLLVLSIVLAYSASTVAIKHDRAVVMQDGATFGLDNGGKGSQIQIPEGTIVDIESEASPSAKVSLPDGRTGIMQRNVLEKI